MGEETQADEAAAAAHTEGRAAARELVAEYEAEHGPIPDEHHRHAREFMAEAGLLDSATS
ncbi:hypothetical protein [Streptomyces sp. SID13031]|uniref:hypothetical protein n=1 Tax=Streptomyces sp. SID13031 TaxID=2706046 RepID=UPI0013C99DC6|nr:hypothetical protein [Streptomyces sp. SID13031]NEA37000.1 hypothetical protein [Streptomyces sp. SID13031]